MRSLLPFSAFAALLFAAFAGFGGAPKALAQEVITFTCLAPAGHVCAFGVQTAQGPVSFAVPSGQRQEVPGLTPRVDKYCVCDPGPVTADCTAPQIDHWCLGAWVDVKPGLNSMIDTPAPKYARDEQPANSAGLN